VRVGYARLPLLTVWPHGYPRRMRPAMDAPWRASLPSPLTGRSRRRQTLSPDQRATNDREPLEQPRRPSEPAAPSGPDRIRVATWNLWWRFGDWHDRGPRILRELRAVQADVIGLQEAWGLGQQHQVAELAAHLGLHWAWVPSPRPERWQARLSDPARPLLRRARRKRGPEQVAHPDRPW
jgi:hypothetical protein